MQRLSLKTFLFFLFSLLTLLVITGCVGRDIITLKKLPLPQNKNSNCCWQVLQELEIQFKNETIILTGAIAVQPDMLSIVLMDPLGRRLISIQQNKEGISSYRSPEISKQLPEHFLLAFIYLSWWPESQWNISHPWKLSTSDTERELFYKNRPLVSLQYDEQLKNKNHENSAMRYPQEGHSLTLIHHKQPLTITVTTKQFTQLSSPTTKLQPASL